MAIKFELIKAGDVLFQKVRQGMGNTTMKRDVVYDVRVVSIDDRGADVVWNGCNKARWGRHTMERLYRSKPKAKPDPFSRTA